MNIPEKLQITSIKWDVILSNVNEDEDEGNEKIDRKELHSISNTRVVKKVSPQN